MNGERHIRPLEEFLGPAPEIVGTVRLAPHLEIRVLAGEGLALTVFCTNHEGAQRTLKWLFVPWARVGELVELVEKAAKGAGR